jgi:hypothetical protein
MNRYTLPTLLLNVTLAFAIAPAFTPDFTGYPPEQFPVVIDRPAIQPAGYAFAIWGPIYLGLILQAGFGLWKRAGDAVWTPSRLPLIGAVTLGTVWLAIALAAPIIATLVILLMAVLAITAFLRAPTLPDRWILSAPIAMFAGWLTAAAAVSTGVVLAGYGWLSNTASTLVMLALVLVVAITVQSRRPAMPLYAATVIWAIIGVVVVNWADVPAVSYAGIIGIVVLAATTAGFWRRAAG